MRVVAYLYCNPLLEPDEGDSWGWDVDAVYRDQGFYGEPRLQLQRLLQTCETDPPDYLLVRRLEDMGDSLEAVAACLKALEQLGVRVIAIDQNYHTGSGCPVVPAVHQSMLMRLCAEIQAAQRSRRIQQGHAQNRLQGLPPPGKAPFGYRRSQDRYVLDRATAPVVRAFFEQFLLFGSLRSAVRYLEKKYGKKISVSTGQRWLINPAYRGDLAYGDGQLLMDAHTAILSREEAAQVDRLRSRNRQLPPRTASASRSLAGLVHCGRCQSSLRVASVCPRSGKPYTYLKPKACLRSPQCRAIPYEAVLEKTIAAICEVLPAGVAQVQRPQASAPKVAIQAQIETKTAALNRLTLLVADGVLDAETADWRAYRLKGEIAQLQQQQAQLSPVNLLELAQTVSIPQFWQDLSEPERRFFFREFIRCIHIHRTDEDWRVELSLVFL